MTELVRSNSVNILWQLPQLFVITVGEILFAVTGLEFSYSQAAPSMKSVCYIKNIVTYLSAIFKVLQALWLLTVFFGNVVDIVSFFCKSEIIIEEFKIIAHMQIADPVAEFFVYAAMMFAVMGIFIVLAMRYQYVDVTAVYI
jgi:solute carrier family 15 oligopeptide transporter 1